VEASTPVLWGGVALLTFLTFYRTDWDIRETILEIFGFRGLASKTVLELMVLAATLGATLYVVFQAMEACKQTLN
jgi:hypothetical protein